MTTGEPEESEPPAEADSLREEFVIRASAAGYSPDVIEVEQDDQVVIILRSIDGQRHGLSMPGYDVKLEVGPGGEARRSFVATGSGRFEFHSHIGAYGSSNLEGVLIVHPRD